MKTNLMRAALATAAACICFGAQAAPQVFRSKAQPGTIEEHYQVQVTRDCAAPVDEYAPKCRQQQVALFGKDGKKKGEIDLSKIARNADGTFKLNVAQITKIDEDHGGGMGTMYFFVDFRPQDSNDQITLPNENIRPRLVSVVLDADFRTIVGGDFKGNAQAWKWLDRKRDLNTKRFKKHEIQEDLKIDTYVEVVPLE